MGEEVFSYPPNSHFSADRGLTLTPGVLTTGSEFDEDSTALTDLCQKQVNYWHNVNPLTDEQISGVKKIAKLAILHRNKGSLGFVYILHKGVLRT